MGHDLLMTTIDFNVSMSKVKVSDLDHKKLIQFGGEVGIDL